MDSSFDGHADDAPGTVLLHAVGFLVKKDKKHVVICMDLDPESREIRFTLSIPRGMVQKMRYLVEKNA